MIKDYKNVTDFINIPLGGAAGIIISFLILYSGFKIAKDTANLLIGSAPDPDAVGKINRIVGTGKYIIGTHDLKIYDYGPSKVITSIHAEVPDNLKNYKLPGGCHHIFQTVLEGIKSQHVEQ